MSGNSLHDQGPCCIADVALFTVSRASRAVQIPSAPDVRPTGSGCCSLKLRVPNATLQGAYLIMAARAYGLDCGPMSRFDHGIVVEAFCQHGRPLGFPIETSATESIGNSSRDSSASKL